jgi:hypothetical protein
LSPAGNAVTELPLPVIPVFLGSGGEILVAKEFRGFLGGGVGGGRFSDPAWRFFVFIEKNSFGAHLFSPFLIKIMQKQTAESLRNFRLKKNFLYTVINLICIPLFQESIKKCRDWRNSKNIFSARLFGRRK